MLRRRVPLPPPAPRPNTQPGLEGTESATRHPVIPCAAGGRVAPALAGLSRPARIGRPWIRGAPDAHQDRNTPPPPPFPGTPVRLSRRQPPLHKSRRALPGCPRAPVPAGPGPSRPGAGGRTCGGRREVAPQSPPMGRGGAGVRNILEHRKEYGPGHKIY